MNEKGNSFGIIVAIIGSILIALGFAWLIVKNWDYMHSLFRLFIMIFITVATYSAGVLFRAKKYQNIGKSLFVLGSLFYTLAVFLIPSMFNFSVGLQGNTNLVLISLVGVIIAAYIFDSKVSLIIGLVGFILWVDLQYLAFSEIFFAVDFSLVVIVVINLALGLFLYGLNLLHRSFNHNFSRTYQFFSLLYMLVFAYYLSFQNVLPKLWVRGFDTLGNVLCFLLVFSLFAILVFLVGAVYSSGKVDKHETMLFLVVFVLFALLIFSSSILVSVTGKCETKSCYDFNDKTFCEKADFRSCEWEDDYCRDKECYNYNNEARCNVADKKLNCKWVSTEYNKYCMSKDGSTYNRKENDLCSQFNNNRDYCLNEYRCNWKPDKTGYGNDSNAPFGLMAFWIFANVLFILVILGVVGYGYSYKNHHIINLGVMFFVLDIITRYVGFITDYWDAGYDILALLFILGGFLLLAGVWVVERIRRKLIKRIHLEHKTN